MVFTIEVICAVSSPSCPIELAAPSALEAIARICSVARTITLVPQSDRRAFSRAMVSASAALATSCSSASMRALMSEANLMNL